MERFNYAKALETFERVNQMDPSWLPGRINLGIALLNIDDEENRTRAIELFQDIINQDSENPYARFCLGILLNHRGLVDEALPHFEAVTRIDPSDPHGWFELAKLLPPFSPTRRECLEKALKLDPYLNGARNALAQELSQTDPKRKAELLKEFLALREADWENIAKVRYTEMGHYADVIGRDPDSKPESHVEALPLFMPRENLRVRLAPGAKWASREDLRKSPHGELLSAVRDRFGATMVELDYNRDGRPDLFLLNAVVEKGQVRDLLLRNDGDGLFTDVTTEAGLAGPRASLGCCVGDFDNNEFPDLFITGVGRQWLFRNDGKGNFEDVTATAGLDKLTSVCLGSAFVDLDQDGDLDLLVAQYAATPEEALAALQDKQGGSSKGGLAVFINVGEAPAARPTQDPPPGQPKFRRLEAPADLLGPAASVVGLALADLDDDHDLDLLVLADKQAPAMVLNDRLLRFHRETVPAGFVPPGRWNGALVLDANHDGRSDLFLIGPQKRPILLISKPFERKKDVRTGYEIGSTNSPPLLQAQAIDLDYDGWTDVVGLSDQHIPVLLRNNGGQLFYDPESLGLDTAWPKDLVAVRIGRFGMGKYQDLVTWSETSGLQLYLNQGNSNSAVKLDVTGHRKVDPRGEKSRCNADGFGVWASAQVDNFWTGLEYTTLSAGLGQSRQPIVLGLGRHSQPDVVRLRWPDNVIQAELDIPACQLTHIDQINLKETSCPILFTWNGERFVFVTDFLGAGSMGELQPDGSTRPPRPEESVKIEAEQLVPRDGKYILKIAEPMNEATYLDRLQLLVLDHPADVRVYPDERFTSDAPPSPSGGEGRVRGDLLAFRQEVFPVKARDHRGKDVTKVLAKWDRDTVNDFAQRSWLGYAEEHWVELDFGDRLAKFKPEDRLILCLAGWTDYPYPESIWAATQAGVPLLPPILERLDDNGHWQTLIADAGFPAGLPRMMTLDVTGKLTGPRCVIRLRTNMEVYWDQVFVGPVLERYEVHEQERTEETKKNARSKRLFDSLFSLLPPVGLTGDKVFRVFPQEVARAALTPCGLMQEFSPDGRLPTIYDYDRQQTVAVSRLSGKMTRYGEVTELLHDRDDRFVIFGPGDELTVEFDAQSLPPLPPGWKRSFVLKTWGYCKDCSLFTATGDTIEPLPFHAMSKYPYGPEEHYPDDPLHKDYLRRYQTRQVGGKAQFPESRHVHR
jgi:tetratricopeptide (TPR) repeat protein